MHEFLSADILRIFSFPASNLLAPATLLYARFITMTEQTMTDQEFRNRADSAMETLRKRLQQLGDEYDFEVEGEAVGSIFYSRNRKKRDLSSAPTRLSVKSGFPP